MAKKNGNGPNTPAEEGPNDPVDISLSAQFHFKGKHLRRFLWTVSLIVLFLLDRNGHGLDLFF